MIISFILCGFVFIYVVIESSALGSAFVKQMLMVSLRLTPSALGSASLTYTIFAIRFASVFFAKM